MNLEDFIDYEKDQKEQGMSPETQAGALASSMQSAMRGTPQGQTGIKYWDEKKEITPYDAYLAKKFNDINFTGRLDINANTKTQSVTKLMSDISDNIAGLENAEKYLELGESEAGFWSGVGRKLNKWSGGIVGIGDKNARIQTIGQKVLYDYGKAQVGGRPSNAAIEDAKAGFGGEFKSAKELSKRTGEMMGTMITALETKMDQLERQGQPIPPLLIQQWQYYKTLADTAKTQKDFKYSDWNKKRQNQAQNTQTNTQNPSNQITPYTPTNRTPQ